jgi:peptidylprolyl isomerase
MTEDPAPGPPTLPPGLEARQTDTGLEILEVETGDGSEAREGAVLEVHCRGWLTNGTPVEDTHLVGRPAELTLGAGQVIPGFEEGVRGMRVGGRRRLILPSDLAYGSRGHGKLIPPYATLIYDVELLAVR